MAVTLVHSDMPDWLVGPVFTALAVCLLVYTSCWVVFLVLASMRVEKLLEWNAIFETQAAIGGADVEASACKAPAATEAGRPSKHRRRKCRRSRLPKLMRFFIAEGSDDEDDGEPTPFDLDDSAWIAPSSMIASAQFIGDDATITPAAAEALRSDAFGLCDDAWRAPSAALGRPCE
mmetsp:Transcript_10716/g.28371  ORF Transcript_10716/g.28371 Transcript_10716/m.28371 type:complete len:176 (+) Transcript_10716:91-618(+)